MNSRIYVVKSEQESILVRATSAAQAMRHAAKGTFRAEVADQNTLVELASKGIKVENADGN